MATNTQHLNINHTHFITSEPQRGSSRHETSGEGHFEGPERGRLGAVGHPHGGGVECDRRAVAERHQAIVCARSNAATLTDNAHRQLPSATVIIGNGHVLEPGKASRCWGDAQEETALV